MAINGSTGSKFYVCATPSPVADDESSYAALTWVEVGEIESISEFGDSAASITFQSLSDGRVRKRKGVRDAGDITVSMARDPNDAGQTQALANTLTDYPYACKIEFNDAASASFTNSISYFTGLFMSMRDNIASGADITKRSLVVGIDSEVVPVASASV